MLKQPSKIASEIRASTTLAIDAAFKKMKADGIDVVGFGAGEPDFNTPDNIKAAGHNAIDNNATKYTPAAGLVELKKAICNRLNNDLGLDYVPEEVVISSGAKYSIYLSLKALIDPGDEIIIISPFWVSYYEMIKMCNAVPVIVEATEAENYKTTAQAIKNAITPKTKAVMINNPSNPTGMLYSPEELAAIMEVCYEEGIYVIADEIYYELCYDNKKFVSAGALDKKYRDMVILVNGVSKSYAMTGWRIGYSLSSKPIAKIISNYQSHSTSAPSTISQMASIEALNGPQETIVAMKNEFEKRRNYMVERMNTIEGVSCIMPEGAFYVMMNITKLIGKKHGEKVINNDDDFARIFLEDGLVCLVPCSGFGITNYVRWSYSTSMENIKMGLDRLEKFVCELQ